MKQRTNYRIRRFRLMSAALFLAIPSFTELPNNKVSSVHRGNSAQKESGRLTVTARSHKRRTLYHSSQTPGFTCWAGIWQMRDGSTMVTFTEATGSLAGWRPRAPASVLRRMPKATQEIAGYDMTGLILANVYLRSTDGGKTWRKTGVEPFTSSLNSMCGGGIMALPDGTILRDLWGQALPYWDVPATGLLQRSGDDTKTWGTPEPLSSDPRLQTWPKRIRPLRDGRILIMGAACSYDPNLWTWEVQAPKVRPCLWVSSAPASASAKESNALPAGLTWTGPLYIAPEGARYAGEEWDAAELENGDLLAVLRTASFDSSGKFLSQERRQCLLTRQGQTWTPGPIVPAPFPHSGMPELLMTREGVLLHIAANGIWWTVDRGATWTKLDMPGTAYYPCALQREDGTILVVSHIGSDDPYGKVDQSIVLDVFRLKVKRETVP